MILVIAGLGNGLVRWMSTAKYIIRKTNIGKQYMLLLNQPNAQYHEHINRRDSTWTCVGTNIPSSGITVHRG